MHHTGMGSARPTVEQTAAFQIGPTAQADFPAIAYTLYTEEDGTVVVCHDLEVETWSQGIGSPFVDVEGEGVNNLWGIANCFSGENPTDPQWAAIGATQETVQEVVEHTLILTSHGLLDPNTTECAGPVVNARLAPFIR